MALRYEIQAIKLRLSLLTGTSTFLGQVRVRIDSPTDSFVISQTPDDVSFFDLSTNRPIDSLATAFIRATFVPPTTFSVQTGIYFQFGGTVPGTRPAQGIVDVYLLRVEGARLPVPRVGADWVQHSRNILANETELGTTRSSEFFPGRQFDLDTLDDIVSRSGVDEGPKDVAPEPPLPVAPSLRTFSTVEGDDAGGRIDGPARNTAILAGDGDDRVVDTLGANRVVAGQGDDVVITGRFNDVVQGEAGDDTLTPGAGDDFADGGAGNDRITGGEGNDTLLGGDGDDVIRTTRGDDFVDGGAGADTILGFTGNETLQGGAGDDQISASSGDDTINGGAGDDRLAGGPGRDTFVFRAGFGSDRILDFADRSDTLDFTNHADIRDVADLTLTALGDAVVVEDGAGGRIVLVGVALADLGAADFLF